MADVFVPEMRSVVMSKVRSKGNKSTELRLIELFKAAGLTGWRRNYPVKGKPDFVFPKLRVAVFADGCFWHGHDCRNTRPTANSDYWAAKRERNMRRDIEVVARFETRGWRVLRIWECELKKNNKAATLERIKNLLG
ncbi:MAG: very short patch repair endonuclease [Clostridiales bacterium]|nr:very short patch repair endonuclease [Clostridiales bacterium]